MKRCTSLAVALAALLAATAARAQDAGDFAGALAVAGEGIGQSLGQSMQDAESVFVYARGRAPLPSPTPSAYQVEVSASAPSAVDAAAQRDGAVERLRAAARAFGAPSAVTDQSISLGDATQPMSFAPAVRAAIGKAAPDAAPETKPMFAAKATMRFGEPANGKAPAFLDALRAAGADSITSQGEGQGSLFTRAISSLSQKAAPEPAEAVWDAATNDAVRAAREQAEVLATAAGRQLGPARQVLLLWRAFDGKEATVTVAVRFGFAAAK